jgi:hypothetical protein
MASPSEAQVVTKLKDSSKIVKETYKYGGTNGTNFDTLQGTIQGDAATDFDAELQQALFSMRGRIDGTIKEAKNLLDPIWRAYGRIVKAPSADPTDIIRSVYDWYVALTSGNAGTQTIVSRQFNFGSVTNVGSPVGDGVIYRLNVDAYGYALEAQWEETKIALCTNDQNSGTEKHEEIFLVKGGAPARDSLIIRGSGAAENLIAQSARASLLSNASFERCSPSPTATSGGGATVTPTTVTDWTFDTISNYRIRADVFYRSYPGLDDTTAATSNMPCSLQFTTNGSIYQKLSVKKTKLNPFVPYYLQVPFYRETSADGTLAITWGPAGGAATQTASVSVNSITTGTWGVLKIPVGTANWYKNFQAQDLAITITLAGRTTGNVLVDEVLLAPYTVIANAWYIAVGGRTPWLRNDQYTWTDTALGSVVQEVIWRAYGQYLPAKPANPTTAAAVGAQSATAGVCTVGAHVIGYTFVDNQGNESGLSTLSGSFSLADSLHSVDVTGLPASCGTGIATVKIYMSKAGVPATLYYTGRSVTAGTTTATGASGVNVADASLTVAAPTGATITDP